MRYLLLLPGALGVAVAATIPILPYGLDGIVIFILGLIGAWCFVRFMLGEQSAEGEKQCITKRN